MQKLFLAFILSLGFASRAAAAEDVVNCAADFSPMMEGRGTMIMAVRIIKTPAGPLESVVNAQTMNRDVAVREHAIRERLDLGADPYGPSGDDFNEAENALRHIHSLMSEPEIRAMIKLSFELKDVRKMRIYDVEAHSERNKFGGTILMEAMDAHGKLLGRAFRSIFVSGCF